MRTALIAHGGWQGHEPAECAAIFRRWLHEDGFTVRLVEGTRALADPEIAQMSLIVPVFSRERLAQDEAENLLAAVAGGAGLAGHHGLADAFAQDQGLPFVLGGQLAATPGDVCEFTVEPQGEDPIVAGLKPFSVRSERYYLHVDPGAEVVATTTFAAEPHDWLDGVVMPVAWKKRHGVGRVFYSALGHKAREFDNAGMATLLRRGFDWAARPDE